MEYKFVYAFTKESADFLTAQGFDFVRFDKKNNIYIFENKPDGKFSLSDAEYLFSNTLTFSPHE